MAHSVEVLLPAQRYVFALDEHGNAEPQAAATSAEGFLAYKRLQRVVRRPPKSMLTTRRVRKNASGPSKPSRVTKRVTK